MMYDVLPQERTIALRQVRARKMSTSASSPPRRRCLPRFPAISFLDRPRRVDVERPSLTMETSMSQHNKNTSANFSPTRRTTLMAGLGLAPPPSAPAPRMASSFPASAIRIPAWRVSTRASSSTACSVPVWNGWPPVFAGSRAGLVWRRTLPALFRHSQQPHHGMKPLARPRYSDSRPTATAWRVTARGACWPANTSPVA
jgi:hypothetical protein